MTQYLRAYYERADDSDAKTLPFIASTEGVKGDGFDLRADSWELSRFRKNPLVLWSHDFFGERPPIGKADARVDGKVLRADITFDPDDEFAQMIERKYRGGFLNAVSVSWDPIDGKNHLLEISAVPIPMDPDALIERAKRGYAEIGKTLASLIDDETTQQTADAEALWTGTAYQMVRLYLPDANDAESARLQTYRRLCRTYERQGKTAPEFLGTAELRALDAETWRGLWLSGEAEAVPELFTRTAVKPAEDDWWTQHV
ncbi:MAG: hypothetical protein MOGMAGMI_01877 [Candidatus Omnitrophica bacterium]|nr:hypothetical protein [Candidatus Omnitrophota bacterium]